MKEIIGLCLLLLLASCNPPANTAIYSLVGKMVEYRYGDSVYHVTFDSDSTMHWEAKAGDESGTTENEIYAAQWIDSQRLFIAQPRSQHGRRQYPHH